MLQGLRRKIGRYAPRGGVKEPPEEELQALKEDATALETAVWHFNRQDKALRRLDTQLTLMLEQIQTACSTMAAVGGIFSETCSDEESGGDYKAAMKQIELGEAERLQQSIRFTVLDPMQTILERHDKLKVEILAWDKIAAESKMLRAVTLKIQSSGLEDDDKRVQTELDLHRVAAALQEMEAKLLPQLGRFSFSVGFRNLDCSDILSFVEDVNHLTTATTRKLFSTTRLQTALFFRNSNQTVLSSLSSGDQELVAEATPPFKIAPCSVSISTNSRLSKMSSLTSDGWTEVDGSNSSTSPDGVDAISGSDEDDESNAMSVTLEDFEAGKAPQVYNGVKLEQTTQKSIDTFKMTTLASYPVVTHDDEEEELTSEDQSSRLRRSTSPSPRAASFIPITPRRTVSMLSTIRKTIRGKLSYATGEMRMIRQSSAPTIDTSAAVSSQLEIVIIPQTSTEWLAIEECMWEIDVRECKSPGKALLTADSMSSDAVDLLSGLLNKKEVLYFECLSYLRVEDLARLSKVNFRLHSHLLDSAPIWKKCIRSGGLSTSIRSSLWLSVFYESTPWRSSGIASHYLSADRRHSMYDQLLAKVGSKMADGLVAEGSELSDDDAQLAVWFREIDVDVVRTSHRRTYANCGSSISKEAPQLSNPDVEDTIKCILNEMVSTIEAEAAAHSTANSTRNAELEDKLRRVLRAYVLYNPRVGYCQGMGFLVRLLAEVAEEEADIFWLFVGFSEPENDRNLYEPGMAVLQPYLSKFELLFSTHMPELYTHFQAEGVHVATFCTRWFLTFFSSFETLAPTLVTRLLDIFIIDGWRIMFSVSLVILDELQSQLLKCDMEGILRILQFPRSYMPEPDQRQLVRHALAFSISRAINSI
ncbi:Ecotropic viral integration site 5 [Phytophthora citrophthora]|uniref:Ecotropic viral integration site 5 n=1 Tax=Phytophthora citrophthora TaxID=4793 RepID=A0AAD9GUZ9_9STRA|nr:Ecotropic viral integration site 5 [Phytophthora citrophthora]